MKSIDFPSGRYVITAKISESPDQNIYSAQRQSGNAQTGSYRVYYYLFPSERLPLIHDALIHAAKKLCQLNHPCLESYIDYTSGAEERLSGEHAQGNGESAFFALLQRDTGGITPDEMIRNHYILSADQWMDFFTKALKGLKYIQQSDVLCHGSISPKILRISRGNNLRFTGIDLMATALHETAKMSDDRFIAPEHDGRTLTPAMDMYALGMTFIQLAAQIRRKQSVTSLTIENLIEPLPEYIRSLLTDMTELEPAARQASAEESLKKIKRHTGQKIKKRARFITAALLILVLTLAGWEYHQFQRPRDREIMTLGGWFSGHGNPVSPVTRLLLDDEDMILDNGDVQAAAFHPAGKRLISAGEDEMIVWNLESRRPEKKIIYDNHDIRDFWGGLHYLNYSRDGQRIFMGFRSSFYIVDASSFIPANEFVSHHLAHKIDPEKYGSFTAFAVDDKQSLLAALYMDSSMVLYDLSADRLRRSFRPVIYYYCTFSPLGDYLLFSHVHYDEEMKYINTSLYCIPTAKPEDASIFRFDNNFYEFAVTPDMSRMIYFSDGSLQTFDLASQEKKPLKARSGFRYYQKFTASPDSKYLACVYQGSDGYSLALIDLDSGHLIDDFPCHDELIRSIGFDQDGKRIFTTSDDQTVKIWDIGK